MLEMTIKLLSYNQSKLTFSEGRNMKKKMQDITFEEFNKWRNMRACDGQWSMFMAVNYMEIIRQVLKVKPLFGRKKAREKEWERIKNERFKLDVEYELD